MRGKWLYRSFFKDCCSRDLFKTAHISIYLSIYALCSLYQAFSFCAKLEPNWYNYCMEDIPICFIREIKFPYGWYPFNSSPCFTDAYVDYRTVEKKGTYMWKVMEASKERERERERKGRFPKSRSSLQLALKLQIEMYEEKPIGGSDWLKEIKPESR